MRKQTKKLSIHLTDKEQIWGICYLLFTVFLLPSLLDTVNSMLPVPLNNAWFNFLYFSLNFLCILWIFHGFFKRSLVYIGHHGLDFFLAILLGFVAYWACNWVFSQVLHYFFPNYVNLNDSNMIDMMHSNFVIMFIGSVLLVPVAEEALYRGLIFGSLYPKSHGIAYLLSSILFSAIHLVGYLGVYPMEHLVLAFVQYIPAGLILAWAYRKSGSIFASMVIHAAINVVGILSVR